MTNQGIDVLLDMDGVIVDFTGASMRAHGIAEYDHLIDDWDHASALGLSADDWWAKMEGREFWANIEPYPWASELMDAIGEFTICTAPNRDPECAAGKYDCLINNFSIYPRDVMMGTKKFLLANPGNVLIDDREENVDDFRARGGCAILFPQPWNHAAGDWRDVVATLNAIKEDMEDYI